MASKIAAIASGCLRAHLPTTATKAIIFHPTFEFVRRIHWGMQVHQLTLHKTHHISWDSRAPIYDIAHAQDQKDREKKYLYKNDSIMTLTIGAYSIINA
jgi:hypothetical protein